LDGIAERASISLVIPCHNGAGFLSHCLAALARVNRPWTEYIVVDDCSHEDLSVVVQGSELPVRLMRLAEHSGPARARNHGARVATGEILVFLDSDTCVHDNTLALIEEAFADPNGPGAVIGSYDDNPSAEGFHSQFRNLLHHYVHQTGGREVCTFWTGCGAVRRAIFEKLGGFNEEIVGMDDVEFGGRLTRSGVRIELRREIQVQHRKRWSFFLWTVTDLKLRGIPWTLLLLRNGSIPNVLNIDYRSRANVALTGGAALMALAGFKVHSLAWAALVFLGAAVWLNRGLYAFFARCRGKLFAAGGALAHICHSLICVLSLAGGTTLFMISPAARRSTRSRSARPDIVQEPNG
jgi:GT2 family glycosyltransferase